MECPVCLVSFLDCTCKVQICVTCGNSTCSACAVRTKGCPMCRGDSMVPNRALNAIIEQRLMATMPPPAPDGSQTDEPYAEDW